MIRVLIPASITAVFLWVFLRVCTRPEPKPTRKIIGRIVVL